jgi:hypothetical protein
MNKLKGAYTSSMSKKLPGMDEMFDEDDMDDFDMEDDKFSMRGNFFDDEDEESEWDDEDESEDEDNMDYGNSKYGLDFEDEDEDDHTMRGARKHRRMYDDEGHLSHGTFGESKVDKIIKKYFEIDDKEKQLNEEKRRQELRNHISETRSEIKRLSETISQERMSVKFLSENKKARLIGITNKKNLVFKLNENQVKISPKGNIL